MIKLIAPESVTDTLVKAMEQADRFTKVIVVAETVEGDELSQMLLISGDTSLADANFLMDLVKQYVLTVPRREFAENKNEDESEENAS